MKTPFHQSKNIQIGQCRFSIDGASFNVTRTFISFSIIRTGGQVDYPFRKLICCNELSSISVGHENKTTYIYFHVMFFEENQSYLVKSVHVLYKCVHKCFVTHIRVHFHSTSLYISLNERYVWLVSAK